MNIILWLSVALLAVFMVVDLCYRIAWWRAQWRAHRYLKTATDQEIADYVRRHGGDPQVVGRNGAKLVNELLKHRGDGCRDEAW